MTCPYASQEKAIVYDKDSDTCQFITFIKAKYNN